jgi:hypothetical protein
MEVFLGGACGTTTWRSEIAIPLLREAEVEFYNPQLPDGAWTPDHQYVEMEAKAKALVWLFVLNEQTRGVAAAAECAYRLGQQGRLALALTDLPYGIALDGTVLSAREVDDLNRGRVFLRAMAADHGVPVFGTVAEATAQAIEWVRQARCELTLDRLQAILRRVSVPGYTFLPEATGGQLLVRIRKEETNQTSGQAETMVGRRWLIEREATEAEVVRTVLKASLTWEEHELRERFRFDDRQIFDPHFAVPDHVLPGDS